MSVKLISDSASDMTQQEAKEQNVIILPLRMVIDEAEYLDGVTITAENFYEKQKRWKTFPSVGHISGSFTAMNVFSVFGDKDVALGRENWLVSGQHKTRASECIRCGKCEDVCSQHIAIRENLDRVCKGLIN